MGTLDLRWGLDVGTSHGLPQRPRLCHTAAPNAQGGDLFSSSLSKPILLGLLPYWNLKDTKQKKLVFCHFPTLHPHADMPTPNTLFRLESRKAKRIACACTVSLTHTYVLGRGALLKDGH